jgi:hypothetical protein
MASIARSKAPPNPQRHVVDHGGIRVRVSRREVVAIVLQQPFADALAARPGIQRHQQLGGEVAQQPVALGQHDVGHRRALPLLPAACSRRAALGRSA